MRWPDAHFRLLGMQYPSRCIGLLFSFENVTGTALLYFFAAIHKCPCVALFDNMSHHCSDVLEADKEEEGEAEAAAAAEEICQPKLEETRQNCNSINYVR